MDEDFQLHASPVATLKAILAIYTFSVGILRELLQNSDDAKATKQIFVLDRRSYGAHTLYHPKLSDAQGPALLAFNDAMFTEADWLSLRSAFESSKVDDTSKIGKYGIGFRSVYHLTDCPQILSGSSLTISDPLQAYTDSHGKRINLSSSAGMYLDQLQPFHRFFEERWSGDHFNGTTIRCPLRRRGSRIHGTVFPPDKISRLLRDFVQEEMDLSLLFLRNVTSIEVYEINEHGNETCLGTASITRSSPIPCGAENATSYDALITSKAGDSIRKKTWRIVNCPFLEEEAISLFEENIGYNPSNTMKRHKFVPHVSLALPASIMTQTDTSGRLFTYLPLETKTGFPLHIHALFALTQSRQNLRNSGETGIVSESDDHVYIEWNKLLFEHFIPRAWKISLELLIREENSSNIFQAWPPSTPKTLSGDSVYWQRLPGHVLTRVIEANLPIWPEYGTGRLLAPQDVIVATTDAAESVIKSLCEVGMSITRPPPYIVEIIKTKRDTRLRILSPEVAHVSLSERNYLVGASAKNISTTVEYLLSGRNILNLVDLPLFATTGGAIIALQRKDSALSLPVHTLFTRSEFEVFGGCDPNALSLDVLPSQGARVLQELGPISLNVQNLSSEKVIDYLTDYPNRLGLDLSSRITSPKAIEWLSAYWMWMDSWPQKDQLFNASRELYMLPSLYGLRTGNRPLFKSRGVHPKAVEHLQPIGLEFLHNHLHEGAQDMIRKRGLLKSVDEIHDVLDALPDGPYEPIDADAAMFILRHFSDRIQSAVARFGPLCGEQPSRLISLPIYPIYGPPSAESLSKAPIIRWGKIPEGTSLRAISNPTFSPSVPGLAFASAEHLKPPILERIEPKHPQALSDVQLLELVLDSFKDQDIAVQAPLLGYIQQRLNSIPPAVINKIKQIPFVTTADGVKRVPGDIIDPKSPIFALYRGDPAKEVRERTSDEREVVSKLRTLRLLRSTLTFPMVVERITYISEHHEEETSIALAKSLLAILGGMNLHNADFDIGSLLRWLPSTSKGLVGAEECRDGKDTKPALYNRVYATLDPSVRVSTGLRHLLKWDLPIPISTILSQLASVLDDANDAGRWEVVMEIIKELAGRSCGDDHSILEKIKGITGGRRWIPTVDTHLVKVEDAVFKPQKTNTRFHQVFPSLRMNASIKKLLGQLGIEESPSVEAILGKLRDSNVALDAVLELLKILPPSSDLQDEQRERVLVPDENGSMQPLAQTFFNDLGDRKHLVPQGDYYHAHPRIDESLVKHLDMRRLGLKFSSLRDMGRQMGAKPIIHVRKTLEQYTEKQFATEFLANALDAGATEFKLCLNGVYEDNPEQLISPSMKPFLQCPSLVIYNDGLFAKEDFEGLCETSVGGKKSRKDTIGQFGLGALTMFYFTELAMIVSDGHVLLLNPSNQLFPSDHDTALLLPLNDMRRYYSSHLFNIDGLFDFELEASDPYPGTIFFLPLRSASQCLNPENVVLQKPWTKEDIQSQILQPFEAVAHECLLFTNLDIISSERRPPQDAFPQLDWSFSSTCSEHYQEDETGYSMKMLKIDHALPSQITSATWMIAGANIPEEHLPSEVSEALHQANIRIQSPIVTGIAVLFDEPRDIEFKYFSTLPLALETAIPAHITASFILSSDRRQIRFDNYSQADTEYNRWLLTSATPSLYLFLLERLALKTGSPERKGNRDWWPHQLLGGDNLGVPLITREFEESFYKDHLPNTHRPVFNSLFTPHLFLSPAEAVLSEAEPPAIHELLKKLECDVVVRLRAQVRGRAVTFSKLRRVDPAFVRDEILDDPWKVTEGFDFDDTKKFQDILHYLCSNNGAEMILQGLHILPLADETFGSFQTNDSEEHYYALKRRDAAKPSIFPLSKFVHPNVKLREILKLKLNISPLDQNAVIGFVRARVQESPSSEFVTEDLKEWILDFWDQYEDLGDLNLEEVLDTFPLVPLTRPQSLVSIEKCQNGSVLLVGQHSMTEDEWTLLDHLGLDIVLIDDERTPRALRRLFQTLAIPPMSFFNVLIALSEKASLRLLDNVRSLFDDLTTEQMETFSNWAQSKADQIPPRFNEIAQNIPIWPAACATTAPETLEFHTANELFMLPEGFPYQLCARFISVYVADYGPLRYLGGPTLSATGILDKLHLPVSFDTELQPVYLEFVQHLILHIPPWIGQEIATLLIPNAQMVPMPCDHLFAPDPLFQAVFGIDSDQFIAPSFQDLVSTLGRFGLKQESDLDEELFIRCAEAIHSLPDDEPNKTSRAAVVYDAWDRSLLNLLEEDAYERLAGLLDPLNFIPRDREYVRGGHLIPPPPHISSLPDVVSPLQLVRKEFEAIAWSQRAQFATQPGRRILMVHPQLGEPTILEVFEHLRYLAGNWRDRTYSERQIWQRDLFATYEYLNRHVAESQAQDLIATLRDEPIFLNVRDPTRESWVFDKADKLVFDTRDVEGVVRFVRDPLLAFKNLLVAAGVIQVYLPSLPERPATTGDTNPLKAVGEQFNKLREQKLLIDVRFIIMYPNDERHDDEEELVAHRSFLATRTPHFWNLFCGGFVESSRSNTGNVRVPEEYSRPCVRLVLDYIYTGLHSTSEAPMELLLEALELSHYWEIPDLFDDIQRSVVARGLITPETIDSIREMAGKTNASVLEEMCDEYENINEAYIQKFSP